MEMVTRAEYERKELEERIAAAEAELKFYKEGLVGIPVNGAEPVTAVPAPPTTKPKVTVVNKNQQVKVAGMKPASAYSRVVSITAHVPDDGVIRYMVTPRLGQNLWLLGVKAWVFPKAINVAQGTGFQVYAGTSKANSVADVQSWRCVLPLYDENNVLVEHGMPDGQVDRDWSMEMFFANEVRQFGITYARGPGWGDDELLVSFKISEG